MPTLDRRTSLVMLSALVAFCTAPWLGFVFDDRKQVLGNPTLLHPGSIPGYFLHPGGYLVADFSYYRPLFGTWMNLNYFLFGLRPMGWHIALVILHILVAFLCYRLLLRVLDSAEASVIGALLFAVHPVHVESVDWISGSTDPLAAAFLLLAFLLYLRAAGKIFPGLFSWLAFAASLLCKETALLFPFMILAYGLLLGDETEDKFRRAALRSIPYFAVVGIYLAVRIHVLGSFSHTLTPLPTKVLLLTWPSVIMSYVRLLLVPIDLSPFYDSPYVKTVSAPQFLMPLLLMAALWITLGYWMAALRRSGRVKITRQIAFFAVWILLFLAPALNLSALDNGEIVHDRYLYLPSIGFCAIVAIGLTQAGERLSLLSATVRKLAVAGLVIILGTAAISQSVFWKDDLRLYKRGASMAPNNLNAQINLANIYLESGDFDRGIAAHRAILRAHPYFADSYFNLGLGYYKRGDLDEAETYLRQAVAMHPSADSYYYLGLAQFKKGEPANAEQALQAALHLDEQRPEFHAALGILYEAEGRLPTALQELEQAMALNHQNASLVNEVAKIKNQLNQTQ